jgi:hypothetical protein
MTEQAPLTLDDVRQRFLEAQAQLTDASGAIEAIRQSADRLGAAREGLADAGKEVARLAERFGTVADAMADNAQRLMEGVEAIRLGDPAAIRREIQELDAAFTPFQSVMLGRLAPIERSLARADVVAQAQQRESRIATAILLTAVVVVGILIVIL